MKKLFAGLGLATLMLGAFMAPASADSLDRSYSDYTTDSTAAPKKSRDTFDVVFMGTLLAIAFTAWGSLPYMVWVLKKERDRRFVPVPVPEGSPEFSRDFTKLSPACEEVIEWQSRLEKREIEGFDAPVPVITSRHEIDKAYEILGRLKAQADELNSDSIHFMNNLGEEMNSAQKRHLNGSIFGLVIATGFFVFFSVGMFAHGAIFAGLLWLAFSLICFLSMQSPAYKLANPAPTYYRISKGIVKFLGIGSLFIASDMASGKYATVYRDRDTGGLFHLQSDREAGCFFSALLIAIVFTLAPFIFLLNSICDFFRNYVGVK